MNTEIKWTPESVSAELQIFESAKTLENSCFNSTYIMTFEELEKLHKQISKVIKKKEPKTKKIDFGSFTDPRDGKIYKTIKIGEQVWLAQNLNFEAEGSLCYDNDPANGEKYGRLYTWEQAKAAVPEGWHLPSNEEWRTLVDFAGGSVAGKKLKAKSGWDEYEGNSGNGLDAYGFSALPCGYSFDGAFYSIGRFGAWWTSSENSSANAYLRFMSYSNVSVHRGSYNKSYLFSVRCLQD